MLVISKVKGLNDQILKVLSGITNEQFSQPVALIQNASLGQHLRHVIEIYQELLHGYDSGTINYAKRKRDLQLESDIEFAKASLIELSKKVEREDKSLQLEGEYEDATASEALIPTCYHREIVYNIEHTIHHMALMRTVLEFHFNKTLPADFGVAPSTIKYRMECAQ